MEKNQHPQLRVTRAQTRAQTINPCPSNKIKKYMQNADIQHRRVNTALLSNNRVLLSHYHEKNILTRGIYQNHNENTMVDVFVTINKTLTGAIRNHVN